MRDKGDAGPHVLLLQQQRVEKRNRRHLRHIKPVHQQRPDVEQLRLADLPAKAQVRSADAQRIGLYTRPVARAAQELANYHDSGRKHQRDPGIRVFKPAHHHRDQFKQELHLHSQSARVREYEKSDHRLSQREQDHRDK